MFNLAISWLAMKRDTRGVTALEYGLIAAVMGAVIIGAFTAIGGDLKTTFTSIGTALTTQNGLM